MTILAGPPPYVPGADATWIAETPICRQRAVMRFSQRLIVLVSGKKIADGTPDTVIRDTEVERAYIGQ